MKFEEESDYLLVNAPTGLVANIGTSLFLPLCERFSLAIISTAIKLCSGNQSL